MIAEKCFVCGKKNDKLYDRIIYWEQNRFDMKRSIWLCEAHYLCTHDEELLRLLGVENYV